MSKFIKILLLLFLFTTNIYANNYAKNRYPLLDEYKLVHACIDDKSFGGVSISLRNKCIEKVLKIENKYSLQQIKNLDKEGNLSKLFD